jgi:hypothetical protein
MTYYLLRFLNININIIQPACAQFGIAGKRKGGTKFQDLQEQAAGGGGDQAAGDALSNMMKGGGMEGMDMAKMQDMWTEALNDPETMKAFESMGDEFGAAMEGLSKMTPEQLQQQMEDAMKMLTDGDMVDTIVKNKEEILQQLELAGTVGPEELAKFKSDPEYFELKMRESFGQMKDIFDDPEMLKTMTEAMSGMQELMDNPNMLTELMGSELASDEKIEEARLELLNGENPALTGMFDTEEMQAILKDPVKFREIVKEGQQDMMGMGEKTGMGEKPGMGDEL